MSDVAKAMPVEPAVKVGGARHGKPIARKSDDAVAPEAATAETPTEEVAEKDKVLDKKAAHDAHALSAQLYGVEAADGVPAKHKDDTKANPSVYHAAPNGKNLKPEKQVKNVMTHVNQQPQQRSMQYK